MQAHSTSERSVWHALLIMPPASYPGHCFTTPFQTVYKELKQPFYVAEM